MNGTESSVLAIPESMIGLLWVYVAIIVVVAVVPRLVEVIILYCIQYKTRKRLIDQASINGLTIEELKSLLPDIKGPFNTIVGTARTPIAITVIVILGIAVAHLIVQGGSGTIVNNILSMLAGLLAAVTGFYFGGRSGEAPKNGNQGEGEGNGAGAGEGKK